MKAVITITIDTSQERPLVLDSKGEGTEDEIAMAQVLTLTIGDSLKAFVEKITGRPMLDAQQEAVSTPGHTVN